MAPKCCELDRGLAAQCKSSCLLWQLTVQGESLSKVFVIVLGQGIMSCCCQPYCSEKVREIKFLVRNMGYMVHVNMYEVGNLWKKSGLNKPTNHYYCSTE